MSVSIQQAIDFESRSVVIFAVREGEKEPSFSVKLDLDSATDFGVDLLTSVGAIRMLETVETSASSVGEEAVLSEKGV